MGAIKVSRTLGQSQLNFAHTFFGFVIADESGQAGCYQGPRRPSSRTIMLQGFGALSGVDRVAKRRVCS